MKERAYETREWGEGYRTVRYRTTSKTRGFSLGHDFSSTRAMQ